MAYTPAQRKEHIREIQHYLHAISYYDTQIPRIIPDGIYGKETAAAVRAFQRRYGLPETGSTDMRTWDKIVSVYNSFVNNDPVAYNIFPSPTFVLGEGDSGLLVYILQAMLDDIGMSYDNMHRVTVDGRYGRETSDAVMRFQRSVNLPQTGRVDAPTWNILAKTSEHINRAGE
ncbi:MAG: peptidoglycan-binding protein [Ruminococcus sp.]|nr:peptidoglycan-binding protein [Ruminococcus sp.]